MGSIKRLGLAYLGVGLAVMVLENWMAHVRAGSSVPEIVGSAIPIGEKMQVAFDLVVMPILAWPIQALALIRGG
jgi:hypothetical protein